MNIFVRNSLWLKHFKSNVKLHFILHLNIYHLIFKRFLGQSKIYNLEEQLYILNGSNAQALRLEMREAFIQIQQNNFIKILI